MAIEEALAWFFILGSPITSAPVGPNTIGPMAHWQCLKLDEQITQPGQCQRAIDLTPCPKDGKKHNIVECPVYKFAKPGEEPEEEPLPPQAPKPGAAGPIEPKKN